MSSLVAVGENLKTNLSATLKPFVAADKTWMTGLMVSRRQATRPSPPTGSTGIRPLRGDWTGRTSDYPGPQARLPTRKTAVRIFFLPAKAGYGITKRGHRSRPDR